MESRENTNNNIPQWIKDIQENSWELELLISGGAIFTLFQMSDIWMEWMNSVRITSDFKGHEIIMILGIMGIEMLKIGFITHLLLRSLWLSMVCVNYVFPQGIKKSKIIWKKPFKTNVEDNEDLHNIIIKIDKYSGLVMYLSISSTFLLTGIILSIFITQTLPSTFGIKLNWVSEILSYAFVVYIIDLILNGFLRRIPILTYLIYPFFKFYDLVTLRFILQKSLFLFRSNVSLWRYSISTLLFFSFALVLSYLNVYRTMHWPNVFDKRSYKWSMAGSEFLSQRMYRDLHRDNLNSKYYIQSKIIKGNFVELYIRYDYKLDDLMNLVVKIDQIDFLSELFEVLIDDIQQEVEWHPNWSDNISDIGITAIIPIFELDRGKHVLKFRVKEKLGEKIINSKNLKSLNLDNLIKEYSQTVIIPFWKDC
jgi:hypothetical protein